MRLLAASDIHIGRIPSTPETNSALRGNSAWDAVVQKAIEERVDAVLLIGDVVEQEDDYFEAYGALLNGLQRLKDKKIKVVAVAGNHDSKIFPRIAKESDAIYILGQDGKWGTFEITAGNQQLTLVGWSFPKTPYSTDPLSNFDRTIVSGKSPCLGMLHCDLDAAADSSYAPVKSIQLQNSPIPLWLLGHIHQKRACAENKALYCGSPYALDSGEDGEHGVWLLEVDSRGISAPTFVPISPHRFEKLSVSLEGVGKLEEAQENLANTIRQDATKLNQSGYKGKVYYKITFKGHTDINSAVRSNFVKLAVGWEEVECGNVSAGICNSWTWDTRPAINLGEMSNEPGPRGRIASILLALDKEGDPTVEKLLNKCYKINGESYIRGAFDILNESQITKDMAKDLLRRSLIKTLEPMLPKGGG